MEHNTRKLSERTRDEEQRVCPISACYSFHDLTRVLPVYLSSK
jgi:hypothetical protein